MQCFLVGGTLSNFLLMVQSRSSKRYNFSCALDKECKAPNSGVSFMQGSEISICRLSRLGFSQLP